MIKFKFRLKRAVSVALLAFVMLSILTLLAPVPKLTGFVVSQMGVDEVVVESFNSSFLLDIKEPPKIGGSEITLNKNERMDFDIEGGLRLYFDMLNYSSFVEETGKVLVEEGLVSREEVFEESFEENVAGERGVVNESREEANETTEVIETVEQADELKITPGITGRVIDSSQVSEEKIKVAKVREEIDELTDEKINEISQESVIELEDEEFEVEIDEEGAREKQVDYKWGYKVKLKEANFISKVDVTSNNEISVLNDYTLAIGSNVLSFKDLIDEGYTVRIEIPSLVSEEVAREQEEIKETLNETEVVEEEKEVINETEIIEEEIFNETELEAVDPKLEEVGNETEEEKENEIIENESEQEEIKGTVNETEEIEELDDQVNDTEIEVVDPKLEDIEETIEDEEDGDGITGGVVEEGEEAEEASEEEGKEDGGEEIADPKLGDVEDTIGEEIAGSGQDSEEIVEEELGGGLEGGEEAERAQNEQSEEVTEERSDQVEEEAEEEEGEVEDSVVEEPGNEETVSEESEPEEEAAPEIQASPGITGSVIGAFAGITGRVVDDLQVEDLEYENTVSVYIEKDFTNTEYEVGDLIYLDPTLIKITRASHLDQDRNFIEDIYEKVRELDGVWTETIAEGEHVRVSFEQNLTNGNDITVYARSANGLESNIEIYEKDGNEIIANIEGITEEGYYKVILGDVNEDTFDLRSIGGLEYDHIIDPSASINVSFTEPPTPANQTVTSNTTLQFNVSINVETGYGLNETKWNWNGINYTLFNDSLVLLMNFNNVSDLGENQTRVVDVGNRGLNGTCYYQAGYGCNWTAGRYGSGISFDGKLSNVTLGTNVLGPEIDGGDAVSIAMWINYSGIRGGQYDNVLMASGMGGGVSGTWMNIRDDAGNEGELLVGGRSQSSDGFQETTSSVALNQDEWYHVVGILNYSTDDIIIAINGVVDTTTSVSFGSSTYVHSSSAGIDRIGLSIDGSPGAEDYFNGTIDEVMVWNKSLSKEEIYQLYASNLRKYSNNNWSLYVNQSQNTSDGLTHGTYDYFAWSKETTGNENMTEIRSIDVDTIDLLNVNFTVPPTPANDTTTSNTSLEFNISIDSESGLNKTIWNWNGTNYTIYNSSQSNEGIVLKFNFNNVSDLGENETNNVTVDLSNNGNNGTCFNMGYGCNWTAGRYATGVYFDGSNSQSVRIDHSDSLNISKNITIAAWIYPETGIPNNARIINKHCCSSHTSPFSSYNLKFQGIADRIPVLELNIGGSLRTASSSQALNLDEWSYVVGRYNGTTLAIFVDGVNRGNSAATGDIVTSLRDVFIGDTEFNGQDFKGTIDEPEIWNTALSDEEIYQLYASNLRKYSNNNWSLYINQSQNTSDGLIEDTYTYFACAEDSIGNENCTRTDSITVDTSTGPIVNFTVPPTPANDTTASNTRLQFNVSIGSGDGLNKTIWNWNGTNYTIFNRSLTLFYNFNNVSDLGENHTNNDTVDLSIYLRNGTCFNMGYGCNWTAGKYGSGLEFTGGSGQFINISDDELLSSFIKADEGTMMAWIYPKSNPDIGSVWADSMIIHDHRGYVGIHINDSDVEFYNWDGDADIVTGAYTEEEWIHVTWVHTGGTLYGYINGVQIGSLASGNTAVMTGYLQVGGFHSAPGATFNGTIDEVMVWNVSFSDEEIYQLYASNLRKYAKDNWSLYINQSQNTSDGLIDDTYTYFACVNDSVGAESCTRTDQITVDTNVPANPNFTNPTPFSGEIVYGDLLINITFTGVDNGTIYLFNATHNQINKSSSGTSSHTANFSNLSSGVYYFNATATDSLNRMNSTLTRNIVLVNGNLSGDGTVKNSFKINESSLSIDLSGGQFGWSVANLGDLNGDGVQDLAVGEYLSDDGGSDNGAVWILFLNTTGGVESEYKINESRFGNGSELSGDWFGSSLANLGDLNGDGVQDLAVGENRDGEGGDLNGAVWILFLNTSGGVDSEYKINESSLSIDLGGGRFGNSLASLGDLNNDGVQDLVVGEENNDDGGSSNGAVWILFLNTSGGVDSEYKINESRFGNGDELDSDTFGTSVANIGDLNNDGVQDLAVGEQNNDDGGTANGAVWILFLNTSGGVDSEYKINESRFGNGSELEGNLFGNSVANLGDLNKDGVQDIAVGERFNDDGGSNNGAFWILFLNTSGGVENEYKINESRFGNGNELDEDAFGSSLASMGDLNNDGIVDIAVGESINDDGGTSNGAVWILNLDEDLSNPDVSIIDPDTNQTSWNNINFEVNFTVSDNLDLDSCWYSNDSYTVNTSISCSTNLTGITWSYAEHNLTIYANDSNNNLNFSTITFTITDADITAPSLNFTRPSPFSGEIVYDDILINITFSDADNGTIYLFNSTKNQVNRSSSDTSSHRVNISGFNSGVYYFNATSADSDNNINYSVNNNLLLINPNRTSNGTVNASYQINESNFGNGNELDGDQFGHSVANIGDLNGDGVQDLAVGEVGNDDGATSNGAVWILFLNTTGGVIDEYKINESRFGNGNELSGDFFGSSVANLGDLNGDGVQDLAVGEDGNDDGGATNGAVWILFLNTTGGVIDEYKINESSLSIDLSGDSFGDSVANIGDLNGDGVQDLAVGEDNNDDGGTGNGAVWILFLNNSGGVTNEYKINSSRFGNGSELSGDNFGNSVANIGDLNGDGVQDLAVGEVGNDEGGEANGAVWILFLNTTGGVIDEYEINETNFGNGNELSGDNFGNSITNLGDLNDDGIQEIAVGEPLNDDGGVSSNGAVWILFLNTSGGVESEYKINESRFGSGSELGGDRFGWAVSNLGDLNSDGIQDLAVGEDLDDGGGTNNGAVWVLFLNSSEIPVVSFPLNASFVDITPANNTITSNGSIEINATIYASEGLNLTTWTWNGTNYTLFNTSQSGYGLQVMYNFNNVSVLGENETNNVTVDISNEGNNGTCINMGYGCNWTAGRYATGIYFDGSNDQINVSNVTIFNASDWTFTSWIKNDLGNGEDVIYGEGNSGSAGFAYLAVDNGDTFSFRTDEGNVVSSSSLTADQWHHIAVTREGTSIKLYLDGKRDNSGTLSYTQSTTLATLGALRYQSSSNYAPFEGTIDEVQGWANKVFTDEEIYLLYASNLRKLDPHNWTLYINQSKNATDLLEDGVYTYNLTVNNSVGEVNITPTQTIIVDRTNPSINITFPINDTTHTAQGLNVNFTVSDVNLAECWYSNDTYSVNKSTGGCTVNVTNVTWSYAVHNLTVYVNDSAGNFNFSSVTFTVEEVDTTPPSINFTVPPTPANSTTTSNTTLQFNISIQDVDGLENVTWNWNGTNYTIYDNASLVLLMNFNNVSDLGENESNNFTVDISGYSNNGTCMNTGYGCNWNITGKYGPGVNFNGSGDYININDSVSLNITGEELTLMAWVRPIGITTNNSIISKFNSNAGGFGLALTNETKGNISYFVYTVDSIANNYSNISSLTYGNWYHIALTFNKSDFVVYWDGYEIDRHSNVTAQSGYGARTINATRANVTIGKHGTTSNYFNGTIDEVQIWNRSLNSSQIYQLYASNLRRYGVGNWSLFVNQSRNSTDVLIADTYTYFACASDISGNLDCTRTDRISVDADTINPDINITFPAVNNSNHSSNSIEINYTRSDNIDLDSCWYSNDTYTVNTTLASCANITGITWSEGLHNLTVYANDTSGNENSSSISFTIDTIDLLNVNFTVPPTPANDTTTSNTSLEFNISIDSNNGLNKTIWNWNGTNYTIFNDSLTLFYNLNNVSDLGENETLNVTVDISNQGNNGTCVNLGHGCNWTAGRYGTGVYFDGDDDYLDTDKQLQELISSTSGTMIAWIYPTIIQADSNPTWKNPTIIGDNKSYMGIFINSTGISYYNWDGDADVISTTYNINEWTQVVWVHNSTTLSAFKNGVLVENIASGATDELTGIVQIGGKYSQALGVFRNFTGTIDEVQIWNRSLSVEEIYQLYASNLRKYSNNNWSLYINQSQNTSDGLIDDTYTYFACANDSLGNENCTRTDQITLDSGDTTNPDINTTFPAVNNTNHSSNSIEINYTRSDDVGLDSCWYSNDTYTVNTTLASCANITGITWSEGLHNLTVYANDTSGNENSSSISFRIDTTVPIVSIQIPSLNNTNSSDTSLDINFTFSDSGMGIDHCWYSNDTYGIDRHTPCGTNLTNLTWSEGLHNLTVYVNDSLGNQGQDTISFTIDLVNPSLSILIPSLNNTNTSNVNYNVNYTVTDTVGLDSCWYSNDTYSVNTTLSDCTTNLTSLTWSEGKHNVTIYANDTSGNENFSSISFTVDLTNPEINITYPLVNNSNSSDSSLDINITVLDGVGLDTCYYSNDTYSVNRDFPCGTNLTNLTWSEGLHNLTVYANDSSNNTNFSTISFRINSKPNFEYLSPTSDNDTTTTSTNLTANVSIFERNLTDLIWSWNGTNYTIYGDSLVFLGNFDNRSEFGEGNSDNLSADLSNGGNNGTIYNMGEIGGNYVPGRYGNALDFDGIDDFIDLPESPSLNITDNITISLWERTSSSFDVTPTWGMMLVGRGEYGDPRNTMDIRIRGTGDTAIFGYEYGSGTNSGYAIGTTDIADGEWHHIVAQWNGSDCLVYVDGLLEGTASCPNTPGPFDEQFSIGKDLGNTFGQDPFNGTIDEVGIWTRSFSSEEVYQLYASNLYRYNLTQWYLYVNQSKNSTDVLDVGSYNYHAWANDSFGNENRSLINEFTVSAGDTTNPDIDITFPVVNNSNHSSNTIEINYTRGDDVGLDSCWYSNDTYTVNTTLASCANITGVTWSEGKHNLTVYANDTSGNENFSSISFTVDLTNPEINITYPLVNNSNSSDSSLDINITVLDGVGLDTCYYSNDTYSVNRDFPCGTNLTNLTWSEGLHNLTVYANDSSNNTNSSTVSFTIDITSPSINITFPTVNNGNDTDSGLDINFTVSDAIVGLGECWYSNDTYTVNRSTGGCGVNITNLTWSNGQHNVTIYVNDSLGNLNFSTISFNMSAADTTSPEISITFPTVNNSNYSDAGLDVNFTVSDINLDECWYSNDTYTVNRSTGGCGVNITNLTWSEGKHNVTIYANDTEGNENKDSLSFTIDTIKPNVTLISPLNNISYDSNSISIEFDYNVSDVNGIANCSFIVDGSVDSSDDTIDKSESELSFTKAFSPGNYQWSVNCTDSSSNVANSSTRNFTVNAVETAGGSSGGGGGGGGGGNAITTSELIVSPKNVKVSSLLNEVNHRQIELYNDGNDNLIVNLRVEGIREFVSLDDGDIRILLRPGERRNVDVEITAPDKAGVYTGRILANNERILVSIDASTRELLFDASILVPDEFKVLRIGQILGSQVTLIPMGDDPRLDVTLNYIIKDFEGRTFLTESETFLVEGQRTFKKEFLTENLVNGNYVLAMELVYPNGVAVSSSNFRVQSEKAELIGYGAIIVVLGLGIFLIALSIIFMKRYKKLRIHKKVRKKRLK